jgi:hypothetical protein
MAGIAETETEPPQSIGKTFGLAADFSIVNGRRL